LAKIDSSAIRLSGPFRANSGLREFARYRTQQAHKPGADLPLTQPARAGRCCRPTAGEKATAGSGSGHAEAKHVNLTLRQWMGAERSPMHRAIKRGVDGNL